MSAEMEMEVVWLILAVGVSGGLFMVNASLKWAERKLRASAEQDAQRMLAEATTPSQEKLDRSIHRTSLGPYRDSNAFINPELRAKSTQQLLDQSQRMLDKVNHDLAKVREINELVHERILEMEDEIHERDSFARPCQMLHDGRGHSITLDLVDNDGEELKLLTGGVYQGTYARRK